MKSRTYGSIPISPERGKLPGAAAITRLVPQRAITNPIMAPPSDSSTLSVNNWRTTRPRSAPSAARMANSRLRAVARASSKLATLAQAMISTNPTAPTSSSSVGRMYPTMSSFIRTSFAPCPALLFGYWCESALQMRCDLRLRRFDGRPRLQAANHPESRVRLARVQIDGIPLLDGNVDPGVPAEAKIGGQHADHGATRGVQRQRLAEDARVGSHPPFPEAVAEHHRAGSALAVFLGPKTAPQEWRDAEHREQARRDVLARDLLGLAGSR